MEVAPWTAPQQDRAHSRLACRQHVVVESIANVGDPARLDACRLRHRREEGRRRLLCAELVGDQDGVDIEPHRLQRRPRLGRLVPGDHDTPSRAMKRRKARPHVVIEIRLVEAGAQPVGFVDLPPHLFRLDVDVGANDPERIEVRSIECRHASQHTEHRESRDAEAVGPAAPDAVSSISVSPTSKATHRIAAICCTAADGSVEACDPRRRTERSLVAVIDVAGFVADVKSQAIDHGFHVHDERHFVETYSLRQLWEVDLHRKRPAADRSTCTCRSTSIHGRCSASKTK